MNDKKYRYFVWLSLLYCIFLLIIKFPLYKYWYSTREPIMDLQLFGAIQFYWSWDDVFVKYWATFGRSLIYVPAWFFFAYFLSNKQWIACVMSMFLPLFVELISWALNIWLWNSYGQSLGKSLILDNVVFGILWTLIGFVMCILFRKNKLL